MSWGRLGGASLLERLQARRTRCTSAVFAVSMLPMRSVAVLNAHDSAQSHRTSPPSNDGAEARRVPMRG